MTHVVTERCVDCRYTDCARVALPMAITLEQVQARERSRGWTVLEPSDA